MSTRTRTQGNGRATAARAGTIFDRIARGIVAGGAGGLVGAGAKLLGELVLPPRAPGEPIPPAVAVSRLLESFSGSPLLPEKEMVAIQLLHWSFSIGIGAAYGALAEIYPRATLGHGVAFGLALCLLTHESVLPLFGFSLPLAAIPLQEHVSELATHALFGLCVEQVRRGIRGQALSVPARLAT